MKKICVISSLLALFLMSCTDDNSASEPVNSDLSGIDLSADLPPDVLNRLPLTLKKSIGDIGSYPSDLAMNGDSVYIVDYSNNVIHRIDLTTLKLDKNYVDLGQNAGPYSVYADEQALYVACQGNVQVLRVNHQDKSQSRILAQSDVTAPTDIAVFNGYTVVADSEYDYHDSTKTAGSMVLVTPDNKKIVHKTSSPNPAFVRIIPDNDDAYVVSTNAGVIVWNADYSSNPPEKSCLDVWKLSDLTRSDNARPRSFCVPYASFGRMAVTDKSLILGNALEPNYFEISLDDVKNAQSSDSLFKKTDLSDQTYSTVIVPVFIEDRTILLDSHQNTIRWGTGLDDVSFYLTRSETAPKGPIDAVFDAERRQLIVLNSSAGSVDVLDVK